MHIEALSHSGEYTYILLNNKTLWRFDNLRWNIWETFYDPSSWRVGDTISISYQSFNRLYALVNDVYPDKPIHVYLTNPYDQNLCVAYISHIESYGQDMGDNIITLNDGSRWHVGSWNVSWMLDWEIGDRIIVSKDVQWASGGYLLMNFDRKMAASTDGAYKNYCANVRASIYRASIED